MFLPFRIQLRSEPSDGDDQHERRRNEGSQRDVGSTGKQLKIINKELARLRESVNKKFRDI